MAATKRLAEERVSLERDPIPYISRENQCAAAAGDFLSEVIKSLTREPAR
jgi:hypothetical protein